MKRLEVSSSFGNVDKRNSLIVTNLELLPFRQRVYTFLKQRKARKAKEMENKIYNLFYFSMLFILTVRSLSIKNLYKRAPIKLYTNQRAQNMNLGPRLCKQPFNN